MFTSLFAVRKTLRKSICTVSLGNFRRNVRPAWSQPVFRRFSLNVWTSVGVRTRSPNRLDVLDVDKPVILPWIILDEDERRCRGISSEATLFTWRYVIDKWVSRACRDGKTTNEFDDVDAMSFPILRRQREKKTRIQRSKEISYCRLANIFFNSSTWFWHGAGAEIFRLRIGTVVVWGFWKNSAGGHGGAGGIVGVVDGRREWVDFFVSIRIERSREISS